MFILGHIGIALGILYVVTHKIYSKKIASKSGLKARLPLDFRIIFISAMIPDIVDKIVGLVIFKQEISNGRIFTHSIVITGLLGASILNLAQVRYDRVKVLLYILPIYIHLLLDRLWEMPTTLFWPLLGTAYSKLDIEFGDYFSILFSNPYVFAGEVVGTVVIIFLFVRLKVYKGGNFRAFVKRGRLGVL